VTANTLIGFIVANVVSFGEPPAVQSRPQALPVTVCEVTQSPDRFVGKRISFHARVESDGIERTVLVDDMATCALGITPIQGAENRASRKASNALSKAIFQGHPGTIDKRISGQFVGVFALVNAETVGLSASFKRVGVLRLESVTDLDVAPRSASSH
jgi:hypothetical protein